MGAIVLHATERRGLDAYARALFIGLILSLLPMFISMGFLLVQNLARVDRFGQVLKRYKIDVALRAIALVMLAMLLLTLVASHLLGAKRQVAPIRSAAPMLFSEFAA